MPGDLSPADPHTVSARFWHRSGDGRVQCDVCPRACRLHEGQRGLCFVRARLGDQMVLTSYGRSSGFCVDPVENKPLNQFLPGSAVPSFGTAGCNLACKFCQNWDISKSREIHTLADAASPDTRRRQRAPCPTTGARTRPSAAPDAPHRGGSWRRPARPPPGPSTNPASPKS